MSENEQHMSVQLQTKAQAFVLIDAFETDLRNCFRNFVADHLNYEEILGDDFETVSGRNSGSDDGVGEDLVQLFYLGQCYELLLRYKSEIPRDLGDELSSSVGSLATLVAIRNRVMHGRPLQMDDLESLSGILARFTSRHFSVTRATRDKLKHEPLWDPPFSPAPAETERVLHNLPMADYDETGLVGRGVEAKAIKALLDKRRDAVITLTGEGGIGKTALALQVAYSIVDDPATTFDCVLWVSLKNEILTAEGVRALTNAIEDISGASTALGRVFDTNFAGSTEELSEYLEGLNALIVLDNLETAQGTEVLELYDALPATTSFLFTSRVGLGEVERRYPLKGLDPKDATLLFRKFASRRQVRSLAAAPTAVVEDTARSLRYSPLAIRWYILSVEAGRTPTDVVRNQTELLRFCVDNVYEALEPSAKLLLVILRSLDRPISFDELAVVAELPIDELRSSSQALARGSLVVRQAASDDEGEKLQISSTARAYLPRVDYESPMLRGVAAREAAYLSDKERQEIEGQRRQLDGNTVHVRNSDDRPTAHLLRLALRFARNRDYEKAELQIQRARGLNPGFYEVDRVAAFITANDGKPHQAEALYRSALASADTDAEKAVVGYFFGGFLARRLHDLSAALRLAEQAHATLKYHDTSLLLGNILVWSQRFSEGQEYLEQALDTQSSKMKRIVTTSIVESWRRWSEALIESKEYPGAFDKALAGVAVGRQMIATGTHDVKLAASVLDATRKALHCFDRAANTERFDKGRLAKEVRFIVDWIGLFRSTSEWSRFLESVDRALNNSVDDPILERVLNDVTRADSTRMKSDSLARADSNTALVLRGVVKSVLDQFGFINHPDYPQAVFFHKTAMARGFSFGDLSAGTQVEFELELQGDGRYKGRDVAPLKNVAS